jgi:outer membrane biogenesis lipoprotein LolB
MRRLFLILGTVSVLLSACSSVSQGPMNSDPTVGCAKPTSEDEKDGGLGGTGKAPDPCEEVE